MTLASQIQELEIIPGVMPSTDATPTDIPCWANALHVRFDPNTGRVRKLGGWVANTFDYDAEIEGTVRTIYSVVINLKIYTIIGTNSYLYSLIGSDLANITPLDTSSEAAANSLATNYGTLANNPVTTTNGSKSIVLTDTSAAKYQVGDSYKLSGATTTNGIPDTEINATHIIRAIGANAVTVRVSSTASSSGSGGGASVVRSTGLITLTDAAHGLTNGQRVKVSAAVAAGGVTAPQINIEFIIRNVTTNTFDFMTAGFATSAVTAAGGAATVYYPQIDAGAVNQGLAQGYGAGLYGVGLYGTALVSSTGVTYPRIWFCDRFGDNIVLTPGNSGGAYIWDGDTDVAPALIPNAPTDINYLFVSDNILVTFGHDVENEIFASDIGDIEEWTASSTNQVFQDVIEGAGRLISHAPVDGYNLIFTNQQTYTMKYIGGTAVWQILPLDPTIGLIGPMARVSVNGIAYWMGQQNFYMFRGGKVEVIPSNFSTQSTIWRYVFDDINMSQASKIFAWHNEEFDEIWFHYPTANSNECNRVARFSRVLMTWVPDQMDRTAGEYPDIILTNPRLANVDILYTHESGNDDDELPMEFYATTRKYMSGTETAILAQVIPDSIMSGTIDFTVRSYNYPQSTVAMNDNTYSVTQSTEKVPIQINGRFGDYTIGGEELGQSFLMGKWYVEPQKGPRAP